MKKGPQDNLKPPPLGSNRALFKDKKSSKKKIKPIVTDYDDGDSGQHYGQIFNSNSYDVEEILPSLDQREDEAQNNK